MPYKQDSGEKNHRKKIPEDAYFHKSNRRIFRTGTQRAFPEPERKTSNDSRNEDLSPKDRILVLAINLCVPFLSGLIYFMVMNDRGYRRKAVQSVTFSLVASCARIYLFMFHD